MQGLTPRNWTKVDVINRISQLRNYRSYLEVCTPGTGGHFAGVDRVRFDTCHRLMYCCPATYDDGLNVDFKSADSNIADCLQQLKDNNRHYEVILVDGFHEYETTIRDLRAMFEVLAPCGLIVVHDCLPLNREMADPSVKAGDWTGVAYKAFVDFVNERTDLFYCTIDCDYGCGLIRKKSRWEILRDAVGRLISRSVPNRLAVTLPGEIADDLIQKWRALGSDFHATYDFMQRHKSRLMAVVKPQDFTGVALGWSDEVRLVDKAADEVRELTVAAKAVIQDASDLSIAVIIPLYNGARYIEMAIKSVLDQSLGPTEIIVVDDGSIDGGPAIVEHLASEHLIKFVRKQNEGQSSARNLGVAQSNSALIAFLDQDDFWYPNHLERLVEPFRAEQAVPIGWVYSDVDEVDESGAMIHRKFLRSMNTEHPKRSLHSCLAQDMFVLPSASLISRVAFERAGGFDERLSGYEDDDLFLRLFRLGFANVFIEESLSQWRIHFASSSYSRRMEHSRMIYANKLYAQFPDDPVRRRFLCRDLIGPRIARATLAQYELAVRRGDKAYLLQLVSDLRQTTPHLWPRLRWALYVMLPLMRFLAFGWLLSLGLDVVRACRRR